ncbi:MAG: ribosome biogenesis GTPase Der, partial [Candidatus Omnitrophica bacterium]|nr:ribosome biogenesis GTPase Der [Candidatus Omnitrophota bacterium]
MESYKGVPDVCIVGRSNVGKSSLFNWLLGERKAVVVGQSGTTRDCVEAVIRIGKYSLKIADTGGYTAEDSDALSLRVKEQIYRAVEEASVLVMVTDAIEGISPADQEVAAILRKFDKPVILAVNKADNSTLRGSALEFYRLGLGDPVAVSCLHRKGMRGLKERILGSAAGLPEGQEEPGHYLKIAIVGRPNVGKSSFVNELLNRERVIVSDVPGTTRDSIDTVFTYDNDDYVLIDTAGIRHKKKIKTAVDAFSVMRSMESIKRADVAVLLLDVKDGVTKDDIDILGFIEESGKACSILVNKWDLAGEAGDV